MSNSLQTGLALIVSATLVGCGSVLPVTPAVDLEAFKVSRQVLDQGHASFRAGKLELAEQQYALAVELGREAEGLDALGCLAYARGDPSTAERYFREAIEVQPHFAPAYGHLAQVLEDRGALQSAEELYQRGISIKPSDAELRFTYAQFLGRHGRQEDAALLRAQVRSLLPRRVSWPLDELAMR